MQPATDKIRIAMAPVLADLPVFVCDLTPVQPVLQMAREAIDALRLSHPDSTPSNVQALYMSPWKSHLLEPRLAPLCHTVARVASEAALSLAQRPLDTLNLEMVVTDCWGVLYEQADLARRHNHFPADFAAVAYLEADADCAPIIFAGKHTLQPRPGTLVVFPGILDHEVPATPGRRVVVAMNLSKQLTFAARAAGPSPAPAVPAGAVPAVELAMVRV
jgi:hypothetical protein